MKQNQQIDDDDKIVVDVDVVVAAEEGEISDSVSIEEISEDDFKKEDEIVKVVVDTVTEKAAEDKVSNNKPKPKTESTATSNSNNSNSGATRVWTMQELYSKYPMSRGYAAGLYNFAWAQAVQNKPLNEVFVMDVVDDEASKSKVVLSSSSSDKVINVIDSCDEMEEGEIEEGEIDMDSETIENAVLAMEEDVINVNADGEPKIDVEKLEEKANTIRDALRCVTAVEAEKSFDGVCLKLQCTLESLLELLKNNIPTKDDLIELSFSGIQAVNSVFCYLDFNKKEHYKEIFSRLISVVINQDPPFFAPERIKEIEAMTKEKPIIGADNSASANAGHKLDSTKSFQSVPNDLSLEKSNMNKLEASKPGMSSIRARWNVAPLLDLHKDHDSDDLPSPTRESPSFFPLRQSAAVGEGMPRPESVTTLKSLMVGEGTPKPEIVAPHKPESVTTFKSLMGERSPKPEIVAPHKPESVTTFKSLMVGEGMPQPEIVTALKPESGASNEIQKEVVSSATRPCVTEAIKAVSTYQQKFGQNSFFSYDQFPSPTPSEESAKEGDEDITGEFSSSNTAVNAKNINSAIPTRPTFIPAPAAPLNNSAPKLNNFTVPEVATDAVFVSSLPNQTLKASSKSRDPRLRLASSSGGVFKVNQHLLPAVSNASKVDNVGGAIRSRTKQDEPVMEGPAHKRQKNDLTNSTFALSGSGGWLEDAGQVGSRLMNRNHLVECKSNDPRNMVTSTNHLVECKSNDPRKMVTSTNHLVDCKSNDPRKMVTSTNHLLECKSKDPRKMVTSTASIPTTVAASGIEKAPEAGTSTVTTTTSLPFLLKDIAVNPTMLLNLLKMGQGQRLLPEIQQGSNHLTSNTLHPPLSNSVIGTDTSANVPSTKSLPVGQNPAGNLQVSSRGGPTDEVGKIRMKPRDPRRFLHNNTVQNSADQSKKNEASTLSSLGNKEVANTQNSEDRSNLNFGSQPVSHTDITGPFTKNLKNIADLVSSSQTTVALPVESESISSQLMQPISDKADAKDVHLESDARQSAAATKSGEGVLDPLKPKCTWGDVEHLFEGFDDKQKAAIQKERSRRLQEQNKMFAARKLCLVLDLDHTLLNSAKFSEVDPAHDEILRKKEEQDREKPHRHLFRFPYMGMWTKLRPGIWSFLEKASKIFEMHLYTMGNKLYATEMAKILDPKGELFAGRVLSRGDDGDITDGEDRAPKSKDLEGVLGMESSVVIIDDSVRVWPHNKLNLIVVERYTYFPCSRRQFGLPGPSLLEIDHDERPEDGTLASCSAVIDRIHQSFFSHRSLDEVDVRNILASEQQKILGGCCILFSRVFPVGESKPQLHPLWQTAEQFGAVCTNQIDDQVTHVVANSLGTDKVNWALSTGRFVVHPGWVEASALLYRRVKEEDFAIKQ